MRHLKKLRRYSIVASLSAILLASSPLVSNSSSIVFAAEHTGFLDVSPSNSHFENIMEARELGFISGFQDGTFKPSAQLTRGHVVKMLGKYVLQSTGSTLDTYDVSGTKPFTDVPSTSSDQELYKLSLVVRKAGVFDGNESNMLTPKSYITRQQMAKVLVNAFELKDLPGDLSTVKDNDKAWYSYRDAINILSENGITSVTEFRPTEYTTRAQIASFMMRAYRSSQVEVISIAKVEAMNFTEGTEIVLPEKVTAILRNGQKAEKSVKWNIGNITQPGSYTVTGLVEGTELTVDAIVHIQERNKKAPVFHYEGSTKFQVAYGSPISLPKVVAVDDKDDNVTVLQTIKKNGNLVSEISSTQPGTYQVIYSATDLDGNKAEDLSITIIILEEDLLTPAVKAAEDAIAVLPSVEALTSEDALKVEAARKLANEVFLLDANATINGYDNLLQLEHALEPILFAAKLVAAIEAAESQIASLPALEELTSNDRLKVELARDLVKDALALDPNAVIQGVEQLESAEAKLVDLYIPSVYTRSYGSVIFNNVINTLSTNFYNLSDDTLTIEKVEVYEGETKRSTYTKASLEENQIETVLSPGANFGISIQFKFNGLWTTSNSYVKYTVKNNTKTFEFISNVK